MVIYRTVITSVITCSVVVICTAHSILESIKWNQKSDNGGAVVPTLSVPIGSVDESVAKRVLQAAIGGANDRKPGEKASTAVDEINGGHGRSGNKWGFTHDCQVICKKSLCIGWGPSPGDVCQRGNYKHRCCKRLKPTVMTSTVAYTRVLGVFQESVIKGGQPLNPKNEGGGAGDSTRNIVEDEDPPTSTGSILRVVDKPITTTTTSTTAATTTTPKVAIKTTVGTTTAPTTRDPVTKKVTLREAQVKINLPERSAPPVMKNGIGSFNGSNPGSNSLVRTIVIESTTTPPTKTGHPTMLTTRHPTKPPVAVKKVMPKLRSKSKRVLPKPKKLVKVKSSKSKFPHFKVKAIPNKPFKQDRKKAEGLSTKIICGNLTLQPQQCLRHHKCDYSCTKNKCVPKGSSHRKRNVQSICNTHACLLDVCPCLGCGLAFDFGQRMCAPRQEICADLEFAKEECSRPNQFYGYAGALCKSRSTSGGKCHVEETILAVNLGTRGTTGTWVDSRNVTYLSDDGVPFEDRFKTKMKLVGLPGNKVDANTQDKILFETIAHGDPFMEEPGHCLTYKVKLWQNGRYELSVKLADPLKDKPKERMFTIRLNGMEVMGEVDITTLTGGKSYSVELFLNFEVLASGTTLAVKGFPRSIIQEGHVDLSFCYGRCQQLSEDQDYVVAAFSVVKFSEWEHSNTKKCSWYGGSACSSRKYGCQHNVVTRETVPLKECGKTWFTKTDCVRPHAFYLNSGVLCRNLEPSGGDCKLDDIPIAVNLNGGRYGPDTRGILYYSQTDLPPQDPHHTIRKRTVISPVAGVVESEKPLYTHYSYGDIPGKNISSGNSCISWSFPLKKDGVYELSFKTAEFYYISHGSRTFNVKVNDDFLLSELDLLGLAPKGTGIDIILNFEVLDHGTMLHLRGFPLKPFEGKFKLEFCSGGCKTQDRNWMLGAFYVARFANSGKKLWGL